MGNITIPAMNVLAAVAAKREIDKKMTMGVTNIFTHIPV